MKQYLKGGRALRTETTFGDSYDVGLENLPALRARGDGINARLIEAEAGGEAARLAGPELTELVLPRRIAGRRVAALRYGDPRVMALFAAVVLFAHLPAGFQNAQLRRHVAELLGQSAEEYSPAHMTYDLGRLVGHGLIECVARSHRYRLTAYAAALCTKLADRILDPGIARCGPHAPPSPAGPWARFERVLDELIVGERLAA